jgi:hypothetical protein
MSNCAQNQSYGGDRCPFGKYIRMIGVYAKSWWQGVGDYLTFAKRER